MVVVVVVVVAVVVVAAALHVVIFQTAASQTASDTETAAAAPPQRKARRNATTRMSLMQAFLEAQAAGQNETVNRNAARGRVDMSGITTHVAVGGRSATEWTTKKGFKGFTHTTTLFALEDGAFAYKAPLPGKSDDADKEPQPVPEHPDTVLEIKAGWVYRIREPHCGSRIDVGRHALARGQGWELGAWRDKKDNVRRVRASLACGVVTVLEAPTLEAHLRTLPYETRRIKRELGHPDFQAKYALMMGDANGPVEPVEAKYAPQRGIVFDFDQAADVATDVDDSAVHVFARLNPCPFAFLRQETAGRVRCIANGAIDTDKPSDVSFTVLQGDGTGEQEVWTVMTTVYAESLGVFGINNNDVWARFGSAFVHGLAGTFIGATNVANTEKHTFVPPGLTGIVAASGRLVVDLAKTVANVGKRMPNEAVFGLMADRAVYNPANAMAMGKWDEFTGANLPYAEKIAADFGHREGATCVNFMQLGGFIYKLWDDPAVECRVVVPGAHAWPLGTIAEMTLEDYTRGVAPNDLMVFVTAPRPIADYISTESRAAAHKRVADAAAADEARKAKRARLAAPAAEAPRGAGDDDEV